MGDALLDELDDVILRMGRLMSARHFGSECNAPDAITLSQALLMRAIESHGAVKMSEVAALLAIKAPAASAAIDALEREGYVERAADPSDRRVTLVTLTPLGCDALHAAETRRRDAMRRHMAVLTDDEIRTLITIHHKLIDAMVASAP
ncbi:MAG: winged helix-turn-helix transcriptional regulator [Coriobacteriia bacterium]|nr:winged helix-turn-helix transcriptional regulator [Coriobacteriia bacterium]